MSSTATLGTQAIWRNKFQTPRVEHLVADLPEGVVPIFEELRGELGGLKHVRESLGWLGIPWRWTLAFTVRGRHREPVGYMVPDPDRPLLCMPLCAEQVCSIAVSEMTRTQRDGLLEGYKVGERVWGHWVLAPDTPVEELLVLARDRHQRLLDHRCT